MSKNILDLIRERKSVRSVFDPHRPVTKEDLGKILEAGRWAPTAHNMQNYELVVVDDKKLLEAIGNIRYPITDTFMKENYENLSFSEEEWREKKVGLLGTVFPPALRTPGMKLDEATYNKLILWWGKAIAENSHLVVVLYDTRRRAPDSEGDFLGIISLGCVLENMWLMANALGSDFQVVSILSADPADKEVKRILQIPDRLKVAFAFRLGHAIPHLAKHMTVRRDVEDFTHHNRFGNKFVH